MPKAGRGFANCIVLLPAYLEMSNMFSVFSIKLTSGSGNRQCAQRGVRRVIACLRCVFRWSFSLLWKNFLFPHPGRFPRLAGAAFRSRCFFLLCRSLFQLRLGNFHPSLIQAPPAPPALSLWRLTGGWPPRFRPFTGSGQIAFSSSSHVFRLLLSTRSRKPVITLNMSSSIC